jgi:hypothetical protein
MHDPTLLEELLTTERASMDQYFGASDPAAYVERFGEQATYFDPNSGGKLEGGAIAQLFGTYAGHIPKWRYEILNPSVDVRGDAAVFTFSLESYDLEDDSITSRWNTTEVHARTPAGWRMVHAHWSHTEPA